MPVAAATRTPPPPPPPPPADVCGSPRGAGRDPLAVTRRGRRGEMMSENAYTMIDPGPGAGRDPMPVALGRAEGVINDDVKIN